MGNIDIISWLLNAVFLTRATIDAPNQNGLVRSAETTEPIKYSYLKSSSKFRKNKTTQQPTNNADK